MIRLGDRAGRGRLASLAILLLALLIATGCSGKKASGTVSGKVTYQGKALRGGSVTFIPADGVGVATSRIAEDGSYKVEKVPAGNVKITVETETSKPVQKYPGAQPPKDSPNYQEDNPERKPGR